MLGPLQTLKADMLATILGILCGMVLGFRFKVLILAPVIALGWAFAVGAGLLSDASWTAIALTMALIAIAVQSGYVAGIVLRRLLVAARFGRRRAWPQKRNAVPDSAY
jgi:hypothetical protein